MVGRRRGRGSARAAAVPSRTPTPAAKQDVSDEEMVDTGDVHAMDVQSPAIEEDDVATPADDEEGPIGRGGQEEDGEDDADSPPVIQLPRKRRGPGRPPRNPRPEFSPDPDGGSESGTPFKKRRGRPSGYGFRGGYRGRGRGGAKAQLDRVPIDKEGNTVDVVDDEAVLPEDPEGERKVDKNGHLQDGRDYRVRVFTIKGRDDRLYMLSTEPARCTGFRDSYLFFTKHLSLFKVILGDAEKLDLIDRDLIPHSYKGRSIGVVTARSVFREFGARIVIGGRKIIDDYQTQAAKDRGDIEGELVDPNDRLPAPGEPYNKNQYVAWHGASQVYHTVTPAVPLQTGKPITSKRRMNVTPGNWQYEHAKEASKFNSVLTTLRRANLDGVYDTHTNIMQLPKIMQPTHMKWETLPPSNSDTNSTANGASHLLTNGDDPASNPSTIFPPISNLVSRNYLTTDTYFTSPTHHNLGLPGPDGDAADLGPNGLSSIPTHLLDELPADCRAAFDDARSREQDWKDGWGTERIDAMRTGLKIGFSGFPV